MSNAMKLLKKDKAKKASPKKEKGKSSKADKKSSKVSSKKTKVDDELEDKKSAKKAKGTSIPSKEEISEMKGSALDKYHATMPEALDGWDELSNKQKRKALTESLHGSTEDTEKAKKKVRVASGDSDSIFEKTVYEVQNLTEDTIDDEVLAALESADFNDFKLGGILSVVDENKYFGEYSNFREKVEADYGIQYRKARYLVETYNSVVESNVPFKKLEKVGWTKLKEIASIINEDNVDEWVKKAKELNTVTLIAEVKAYKQSGKTKAETSTKNKVDEISTFTCKVHADQKENIEAAIDKAYEEAATDSKAVAVEYICLEYLSGGKKAKPSLKGILSELKKTHGKDEEAAYAEFVKVWNGIFKTVELE